MASDRRGQTYRTVTLAEGAAPGRQVRAACACGARASVDIAPWLALGLAALPLNRLEHRLRCAECGARSVPLEIGPDWAAPPRQGRIHLFR